MADGSKPEAKPTVDVRGATALQATVTPSSHVALPAPPPMPADWRYTVRGEIARGGMGRVVEATDTVLGRTVALKEALSIDPDAVRRFQRETRITARLEHPSIVPVHDAGIAPNGSPFYVMRKISGRPLEDLVGAHEALPERLALLPHIVAAAHAVAHAHERGIVHRDIKPSNILVGELGETIVIDWGLAKAFGEPDDLAITGPLATASPIDDGDVERTRAGVVFGTPGFIAPEQLHGAAANERSDVYALGATLYHLLARRPPHHAPTADDMMKATAAGPPRPLREILVGVPAELTTIVDKALARDPDARYRDAGELAEDLQRFLTGKLVASHHYSRRDRALRFVRKNRALVGVTAVAVTALALGGWLAIGRILDERDRADAEAKRALEQKRVAETEREQVIANLAQLTLTEARTKADVDPTRAIAIVRPLVSADYWREVRAIAADARGHGVAFGLPASPHTLSLEISRDGGSALAAGDDGIVRIYDLAHRTSRTVVDAKEPTSARFADGERTIVMFHERHVAIVDAASGARRDVTVPSAIRSLEVSGPFAYYLDPDRAVWRLDLAGGAAQKLPLDEPIAALAPSPDGRWIALAGAAHVLLVDRTQPTLPPEAPAEGETRALAWAVDASHLVALVGQDVVDISMVPAPSVVRRQMVGNRFAVAYSAGEIFTAGPTGAAAVARDDAHAHRVAGDFALGLREAQGGVMVGGGAQSLVVMSDDGDHVLASPATPIARIAASPHGPWVLAAVDGRVLAWDLDALEPRHVTMTAPSGARFVGDDQVITTYVDGATQWLDLRTGKATPLGMIPGIASLAAPPDAARALVIDTTHHAHIVAPVGDVVDIVDDLALAAFVDDKQVALATMTGAVQLQHASGGRPAVLVQRSAGIAALAARSGWIAAAFSDRALWRTRVGETPTTLAVAAAPPRGAFALADDGTVVFATGGALHVWRSDGSDTTLATLAKPIVAIAVVSPQAAVVVTDDGEASRVGLARSGDVVATIAMPPAVALGNQLGVAPTHAGGLEVFDPLANAHWPLAGGKGLAPGLAEVSPGDARVLAVTPNGLYVWTLALPTGPDDTAHWLDTITNAVADRGPAAPLGWR